MASITVFSSSDRRDRCRRLFETMLSIVCVLTLTFCFFLTSHSNTEAEINARCVSAKKLPFRSLSQKSSELITLGTNRFGMRVWNAYFLPRVKHEFVFALKPFRQLMKLMVSVTRDEARREIVDGLNFPCDLDHLNKDNNENNFDVVLSDTNLFSDHFRHQVLHNNFVQGWPTNHRYNNDKNKSNSDDIILMSYDWLTFSVRNVREPTPWLGLVSNLLSINESDFASSKQNDNKNQMHNNEKRENRNSTDKSDFVIRAQIKEEGCMKLVKPLNLAVNNVALIMVASINNSICHIREVERQLLDSDYIQDMDTMAKWSTWKSVQLKSSLSTRSSLSLRLPMELLRVMRIFHNAPFVNDMPRNEEERLAFASLDNLFSCHEDNVDRHVIDIYQKNYVDFEKLLNLEKNYENDYDEIEIDLREEPIIFVLWEKGDVVAFGRL